MHSVHLLHLLAEVIVVMFIALVSFGVVLAGVVTVFLVDSIRRANNQRKKNGKGHIWMVLPLLLFTGMAHASTHTSSRTEYVKNTQALLSEQAKKIEAFAKAHPETFYKVKKGEDGKYFAVRTPTDAANSFYVVRAEVDMYLAGQELGKYKKGGGSVEAVENKLAQLSRDLEDVPPFVGK